MYHLVKTEQETITLIPIVQRLYAVHMLKEAGIPFKTIRARDIPEGTVMKCVFRGQDYPLDNITAVQACVTSESLIKALEEKKDH